MSSQNYRESTISRIIWLAADISYSQSLIISGEALQTYCYNITYVCIFRFDLMRRSIGREIELLYSHFSSMEVR